MEQHTFLRLQLAHCPNVQGWFLLVDPGDIETEFKLHGSVASNLFQRYAVDPHSPASKDPTLYNVPKLAAGWMQTLHKLHANGKGVVMNAMGGLSPLSGWNILSELQLPKLQWPQIYDNEKITIFKYGDPSATHYYLKSDKGRVFSPAKYNGVDDAMKVATTYVAATNIVLAQPTKVRPLNGD